MNGVFLERFNFRLVYLMELWTAKEWQREGKPKETLKTENKWSLPAVCVCGSSLVAFPGLMLGSM